LFDALILRKWGHIHLHRERVMEKGRASLLGSLVLFTIDLVSRGKNVKIRLEAIAFDVADQLICRDRGRQHHISGS
jgi:hypothetical protein